MEWFLGGYPVFCSAFSFYRSEYVDELKAVLSWNTSNERPHPHYNAFVASDRPVEQWCGGERDFIGPYGTPTHPKSLLEGRLSCREAWCEQLAGALAIPVKLDVGETAPVNVLLGSFDTQEEAARRIHKIMPAEYRSNAWKTLHDEKSAMLAKSVVRTPDEQLNTLINVWAKQQIQLCAEFGRDGARGFRDTLQDAWGILPFNPKLGRDKIIETLSHGPQFRRMV